MAVALVNHLVAPDDPEVFFDFAAELERLIRLAERQAFGPSTQALIDEAGQPRHPVHPARPPLARPARPRRPPAADPGDDDLADVGHRGRHRVGQEPDQPAARLGRPAGARARRSSTAPTTRRSRPRAARLPVRGQAARRQPRPRRPPRPRAPRTTSGPPSPAPSRESRSGDVVVETYVAGNDYRCLVIGGKVAAIAERVPASVTGDGEHTVRELVDIANADPRRGIGHEKVLTRIKVDDGRRGARPRAGLRARRRPARRAPGSSSP